MKIKLLSLFCFFYFTKTISQTVFWSDTFETGSPTSGTRTPEENGGTGGPPMTSYFVLTNGSTVSQVVPFTGKEGTNYWAGEDHNAAGTGFTASGAQGAATNSPNNELQIIWNNINISGKTGISFRGLIAANNTNEPWDNTQACISGVGTTNTDYIIVEYSINGGPYTNLIRFYNRGSASGVGDKYLFEDTDGNGCGDGTQLTNVFNEFTKSIPGTGTTLNLLVRVFCEGNNEEWAIDNFRLYETVLNTNDFDSTTKLSLSPNPSNGIFNIEIDQEGIIEVFDIIGKKVKQNNLSIGDNKLDLSQTENGIYVAKVTNSYKQTKTIRLIKQ